MRIWTRLESDSKNFQGGVVTIGNFDGLHLGHQSLLLRAAEVRGPRVVMTFDPHPLQLLRPERKLKRLLPREDLAEQLPRFGVDLLVVLPFDEKLAATSAREFWEKYIRAPFRPLSIVAGHDFGFGNSRAGTLEDLAKWCAEDGASLHVLSALSVEGQPASSRRLREMIEQGDVERARLLLARPFYLRGEVIAGAARGRQLGFPTLNMRPINETLPAVGVYATRARFDGATYDSVTNVGVNPTFGGDQLKVETHVLGRTLSETPIRLDVDFIKRLRPEMKFASIEDLKKQIQSDILKAHETLDGAKSK